MLPDKPKTLTALLFRTAMNLPSKHRYNPTSMALHWLMAALLCGSFWLGLSMVDLPFSPQKLNYFAWHKWLGCTIFGLAILRLVWRLYRPAPAQETNIATWQKTAARWGHIALYGLMFAMPVSGWLMSSAKGVTTTLYGLWALPNLLSRDRALGAQLESLHQFVAYAMLAHFPLTFSIHFQAG